MRFNNQKGLALLEVVIAAAIVAIMGSVGMVSWAQISNVKSQKNTEQNILAAKSAYIQHYENTGSRASSLQDLVYLIGKAPRDGWRQPLTLWEDVSYDPDGNGAVEYDAVIISPGQDTVVDSSVDASGNLTLSSKDTATLVSLETQRLEKLDQAAEEMKLILQAALSYYDKTGTKPSTIADLDGHIPFNRKDSSGNLLDPWRSPYQSQDSTSAPGGFFSVSSYGPDRSGSTSDDLENFVPQSQYDGVARNVSLRRIASANAALSIYETNWGDPGCSTDPAQCVTYLVVDPLGNALMDGKNAYDAWGRILIYDASLGGFFSTGPDGDSSTLSDNVR
ncbi:hypothetical protein [Geoalkalibacter subterraneus]|uniref:Type II secretion system protein GspG C-terminal domain-containing protein n=1 Tax=Geoalkalibacter subterraneus TaxID=483547 RepID=A0A0B5FVA7_9BACT|nr:hypothetical protein [Geoalkalibacter subterraneus]AJF08115.1 hypothetical protein GSUB_16520 [Geoalkalibacter subterraneus]